MVPPEEWARYSWLELSLPTTVAEDVFEDASNTHPPNEHVEEYSE